MKARTLVASLAAAVACAPAVAAEPAGRVERALQRAGVDKHRVRFWQRVHRCEQPSTWFHPGPTYPGGLGIYAPNWRWWAGELGVLRFWPRASSAPPLVQIAVANHGYERHGGYWGCFKTTGRPR